MLVPQMLVLKRILDATTGYPERTKLTDHLLRLRSEFDLVEIPLYPHYASRIEVLVDKSTFKTGTQKDVYFTEVDNVERILAIWYVVV